MLTSRQLAKELITRKKSTQRLDTSITTSSYEMINPDLEGDVDTSDDSPRRHFWGLPIRRNPQHHPSDKYEDAGDIGGRRVVSEPVMTGRRGMSVLRRFRFGRHGIEEDEHEGDLTISTETDVSIEPTEEEEISPIPTKHRPTRTTDSGPSFISFDPTTPSSTRSSQPRSRQRPRNPTPQSAISRQSSSGQELAPTLDPPFDTPTRGAAIRAVTIEAQFADTSISFSTEESGSVEYPSYVDTSSSLGGILRARHSRVPNNTPVQTVRFLDSPRTEYLRRKARERLEEHQHPVLMSNTPEPLPPAQITQSSRWARLGNILNNMENEQANGHDINNSDSEAGSVILTSPKTPHTPTTPNYPRSQHRPNCSSSDSPISFARFDPLDPICSTPLRKYRFPTTTPFPGDISRQSPSDPLYSPLSGSDLSVVSSPAWSRRFADEDEVVEVCTALEALWEYGSSSEEDADIQHQAGSEGRSGSMQIQTGASVEAGQEKSEFPGDRRGSADLLPLKYKGYPREVVEEPFPFASSLRF